MDRITYRITVGKDPNQYKVTQYKHVTYVEWKNANDCPYVLAYNTSDAIQYLREKRWNRVGKKSPNLFSLSDL